MPCCESYDCIFGSTPCATPVAVTVAVTVICCWSPCSHPVGFTCGAAACCTLLMLPTQGSHCLGRRRHDMLYTQTACVGVKGRCLPHVPSSAGILLTSCKHVLQKAARSLPAKQEPGAATSHPSGHDTCCFKCRPTTSKTQL